MSVLDKFLNAMKLNDDDGFDNEDYLDEDDYEDDDYADERPKKRILSKYEEDDRAELSSAPAAADRDPAVPKARPKVVKSNPSSKIAPMRPKRGNGMEVCVIKPRSMEDTHEITETLQEECTVVLNMEGLDLTLAQRIIDFSCGTCYALHGGLQQISNNIFIITPASVDISGDFQEVLNGAFGVPAFETRF